MQALTGLDSHQLQAALNRDALIHKFETGRMQGNVAFPARLFIYLTSRYNLLEVPPPSGLVTLIGILPARRISEAGTVAFT
jgi:hypothetical protein